jgi:hypothetical protein
MRNARRGSGHTGRAQPSSIASNSQAKGVEPRVRTSVCALPSAIVRAARPRWQRAQNVAATAAPLLLWLVDNPNQGPHLALSWEGPNRTPPTKAIKLAAFRPVKGDADVTAHRQRSARLAALLALGLGIWGWQARDLAAQSATGRWATAAAKSDSAKPAPASSRGQGIVVVVNDEPITGYEIEQRARFLGLSANVGEHAKEAFQRLVKSESTEARMRALQQDVIRSNPGMTRDQLIAIIRERQKEIGMSLQKQALENARTAILPKLRKDAREELIDERLKVQAAKKLGIVVSDNDVKTLIKDIADRNKMTYEQFAQHLKGTGVDISTMGERFRAQKAWRDLIGRRYSAQVSVSQRDVDRALSAAALEAGEDTVELQVQKLALHWPARSTSLA